jgi:sensor c-di-GMP phosphodiesterase-like protein
MVIGIAKSLHLDLIAEGVETVEQLEFLRREGCRQIQGFYFSQPLTPEDALDYMKRTYNGHALPAANTSETVLA